jgi:hypothetical protein
LALGCPLTWRRAASESQLAPRHTDIPISYARLTQLCASQLIFNFTQRVQDNPPGKAPVQSEIHASIDTCPLHLLTAQSSFNAHSQSACPRNAAWSLAMDTCTISPVRSSRSLLRRLPSRPVQLARTLFDHERDLAGQAGHQKSARFPRETRLKGERLTGWNTKDDALGKNGRVGT